MRFEPWCARIGCHAGYIKRHIHFNEYWSRTWIVQEVMLVRRVVISLDSQCFQLSDLLDRLRVHHRDLESSLSWKNTPLERIAVREQSWVSIRGQSLINILARFHKQKCSLVHDRVYALLSLCEQYHCLLVNYAVSRKELAYAILASQQFKFCFCSVAVVVRCLNIRNDLLAREIRDGRDIMLDIQLSQVALWPSLRKPSNIELVHVPTQTYYWPRPYEDRFKRCVDGFMALLSEKISSNDTLRCYVISINGEISRPALGGIISDCCFLDNGRTLDPDEWFEVAPGWRFRVENADDNVCTVRTLLGSLAAPLPQAVSLCYESNTRIWKPSESPIDHIQVVYG